MTTNKQYEKIRAIYTTVTGDRFAVGEWNRLIQVWDLEKGFIRKFESDLASAMPNAVSMSNDSNQMAVAGYDNRSFTLYNVNDGTIIWQRKDLSRPSAIVILNKYPDLVYINTEKKGAYLVDRKNGQTIETLRGIEYMRENEYAPVDHLEHASKSAMINRENRKPVKSFYHKSFALLDACFTDKNQIICAYAAGPLAAISLSNFKTEWEIKVVGHFLDVGYSKELNKILGIRWEYEKGSPKYLCYIDPATGKVEKEVNLGDPIEVKFLKSGSLVLTSQGKLYSALTATVVKEFDFENH